jgi:hypothetical protein
MCQWEVLVCYNKEIRNAKRFSRSEYCQITDVPGSARLMKILAKQSMNRAELN